MANERCRDVRCQFLHLLRGEKDPVEMADLFRHLAECADCATEFRAEAELDRRLRNETARYVPPPDLRAAVETVIRRRRVSRWAAGLGHLQALFHRPLMAATAGAFATLLLALPVSRVVWRSPTPDAFQSLVAEAASGHWRMALQQDLLRREQADTDRMVTDIQERFGLPAVAAFRGDREVRLLAVRPTFVLGRPGATFVYAQGPDRIVTLTLLSAREIQIPKEGQTQIETYRPVVTRRDSIRVVIWKQGETAYALTAPASGEDLSRLFLKVRKAGLGTIRG